MSEISAEQYSALVAASLPGFIVAYGGTSAPTGWLMCDGQAVSRTTYATLFGILSTAYGVGDGSTTFNLPDLRQRFPLGKATSGTGATLGGTGGSIDHIHGVGSLAAANESSHTHTYTPNAVNDGTAVGTTDVAEASLATTDAGTAHTHSLSGSTDAANPPFQTVNYLIRV